MKIIILLCFIVSFSFSAQAGVKNPDTLVVIKLSGDITGMDPAHAYDVSSLEIATNIYETLIDYKGESVKEYIPILSKIVPSKKNNLISKDGKTYKFPMRKGVLFHDGSKFTCKDARYSFLRFMLTDPAGGPASLLLEPLTGKTSTRDKEGNFIVNFKDVSQRVDCKGSNLVFSLPKPYQPFLSILAQFGHIVNKQWAVKHGDWDGKENSWKKFNNPKKETSYFFNHTNGTGPFMLERWDQNVKQISLARHDKYWREPAKLKRVVIKGISEFSTRRLMIAAGDADITEGTRQFETQLRNLPGVRLINVEMAEIGGFFFNYDINPTANPAIYSGKLDGNGIPPDFFSDKDVRLAFAHAFDFDAYINSVLRGKARRPTGCIPAGWLGHNPNGNKYRFDLDLAIEHFRKAWGGKVWKNGFKYALYYDANNETRHLACEILKKRIESLSPKFKIETRPLQWSTYISEIHANKIPMFKLRWIADFADPHNFAFPMLHSKGRYAHRQRFNYPRWDTMIEKANLEQDPKKREQIYFELQKLAHQEAAQIYTDQPLSLKVVRTELKGLELNPMRMGYYFYPIHKEVKSKK
ncbi:ABC transporter substrate-binding protein [Elusimicrobiota bacterium]